MHNCLPISQQCWHVLDVRRVLLPIIVLSIQTILLKKKKKKIRASAIPRLVRFIIFPVFSKQYGMLFVYCQEKPGNISASAFSRIYLLHPQINPKYISWKYSSVFNGCFSVFVFRSQQLTRNYLCRLMWSSNYASRIIKVEWKSVLFKKVKEAFL